MRLDEEAFEKYPKISIDYAVMEHTKKAAVMPANMGWSDIGSWSELWALSDKDSDGNVISSYIIAEDRKNCYLHTYNTMVATIGLTDMIADQERLSALGLYCSCSIPRDLLPDW